ncbi:glycosyltransferase 87 family protein [Streptomyces orinoci]|uniref:Glycosyltransferase 87 family protein n=1 Tax=Streptomyces orinoci TaxID=67339 RepID=A0ABV3K647_STRON|nr:glycosyltransferase 87 family protein [Streptomyces orinoci]
MTRPPAARDEFGRWLSGRASRPLLCGALLLYLLSAGRVLGDDRTGIDNAVVVRAAHTLLDGGAPYADRRFLYPPAAVFAAVPQVPLGARTLFYLAPAVTALLVLAGALLALRIFRVRADSRLAAALAVGLAFSLPFQSMVHLGNWTCASVVAFPGALLLARRGRWTAAGALVGAALALKPMLVPLLLLFALARRWRALAMALAVPVAVSLPAALAMPRPGLLLTKTLPFLLHGQDSYARPFDASWPAVLARLGVGQPFALLLAVPPAAAALWFARLRWHGRGEEGVRLVECASLLMLSAFLVSRPAFLHYALVPLPSLAASAVVRGAAVRSVWFWTALLPQLSGVPWPELGSARRHAFKDIVMYTGLAAVLARTAWRIRPRTIETVTVSGGVYSLSSDSEPRNPPGTR